MTTKQIQKSTQNIKQYTNITDAVVDYANSIKDNFHTNIIIKINKDEIIDYSKELQTVIFRYAKKEFQHIGKKIFNNNNDIIHVSNGDIKESIAKTVRNSEQKQLLKEHIVTFAHLDKIIENGEKITSTIERKKRYQNLKWDYYLVPIIINRTKFIIEFDIVTKSEDNQKHFRILRIFKLSNIKKQITPTGMVDNQLLDRFVE